MTLDTRTIDLDKVDLTDLNTYADGPPHELFARMRREAPVRWNPSANGPGFWSLTRAQDIEAVSADTTTFSSARGGVFLTPETLAPLEFARNWVLFKDPPEHSRYRDIVRKAFLPRTMIMIDEVVRQIVSSTLDDVVSRGECDLVRDVAVPIPLRVIGRLLGAGDEDTDLLLRWTEEIGDGITNGTDVVDTLQVMSRHLAKLVDNQVVRGVESLANAVMNAEHEGERLDEQEVAAYFGILLFAGNDPTRNSISSGMLALLENPDQLTSLQNDPFLLKPSKSGLAPAALQEILRWSSPVNYFARTATADVEIGGQTIRADDRLVMWYASANRDTEVIPDADRFDITRDFRTVRHFTFGGGGPHRCHGAFLAHKMLAAAINGILARLPEIRLVGSVERKPSAFVNQLTAMPVQFTACA